MPLWPRLISLCLFSWFYKLVWSKPSLVLTSCPQVPWFLGNWRLEEYIRWYSGFAGAMSAALPPENSLRNVHLGSHPGLQSLCFKKQVSQVILMHPTQEENPWIRPTTFKNIHSSKANYRNRNSIIRFSLSVTHYFSEVSYWRHFICSLKIPKRNRHRDKIYGSFSY